MAEHELNKIVDSSGDVFNIRDATKQPVSDRVTAWGSTPSDTKYPSEKLVKESLDSKQATLTFDGTYNASTNKAATVSTVTNAIGGLDVSSVGGNGKYISAISETDGKISATETNIDDALSATSTHPVQNKELTRWHNIVIGEDGFVSGSAANPQLSLQKSRLGGLSLYNAGVNIKIYSFDENDEENATLEWDVSTASDSIKALYNKGEQTGTLYQSTAGKWVKILYTGTTSSYFRALGVFMDTKDSSSSVSNFYGHLRIGGVDYPESAQFTTWGSLVIAAYSKTPTSIVELILRPKSATCMCRIFGFRCLNTYTGSDAILIGKASSAFTTDKLSTARKLKTNLARTADSTFDGSANQENIPVTGTLPVANGGTGKASVTAGNYLVGNGTSALQEHTPMSAANNMLSALPDWTANPTDSVKLIRRDTAGGASFGQVTFLTVWNYIKGKISSVLGLTETSYGGNAATATTAAGYTSGGAIDTALQGKQDDLGISGSGDTTKFLNEKGQWATPTGTAQVQSDWTQTTPTAADYIKNKPDLDKKLGLKGNDGTVVAANSDLDSFTSPGNYFISSADIMKDLLHTPYKQLGLSDSGKTGASHLFIFKTTDSGRVTQMLVTPYPTSMSSSNAYGVWFRHNTVSQSGVVTWGNWYRVAADTDIPKLYSTTSGQNTDGAPTQAAVNSALSSKADTSSLATVATSGSYRDLTNTPDISKHFSTYSGSTAVYGFIIGDTQTINNGTSAIIQGTFSIAGGITDDYTPADGKDRAPIVGFFSIWARRDGSNYKRSARVYTPVSGINYSNLQIDLKYIDVSPGVKRWVLGFGTGTTPQAVSYCYASCNILYDRNADLSNFGSTVTNTPTYANHFSIYKSVYIGQNDVGVGSPTFPVYVDANGSVKKCIGTVSRAKCYSVPPPGLTREELEDYDTFVLPYGANPSVNVSDLVIDKPYKFYVNGPTSMTHPCKISFGKGTLSSYTVYTDSNWWTVTGTYNFGQDVKSQPFLVVHSLSGNTHNLFIVGY